MNIEVFPAVLLTGAAVLAVLWMGPFDDNPARAADGSLAERARRLHDEAIVIDTHSDTTLRLGNPEWSFMERHEDGHLDLPRMREGGLDAAFLAVYMGEQKPEEPGIAVRKAMDQFDWILSLAERAPDRLELARTAADIRRIAAEGRNAILIGVEGGHMIDNDLAVLRGYYRLGARYMTLTHTFHHDWADSSGFRGKLEPRHGGLTEFGREVIREMNRLGMMVDVSHVSDDTFWDVMEVSAAPVVATHSAARALCDHQRNLRNEMIQAMAEKGGVVQVVFFPGFLDPRYPEKEKAASLLRADREAEIRARFEGDRDGMRNALRALRKEIPTEGSPFSLIIDHIEHIINLVGPDHVGLGADWDGIWTTAEGMEDCSRLPAITEELLRRGHGEDVVKKVLGENLLRVMEEVEEAADR